MQKARLTSVVSASVSKDDGCACSLLLPAILLLVGVRKAHLDYASDLPIDVVLQGARGSAGYGAQAEYPVLRGETDLDAGGIGKRRDLHGFIPADQDVALVPGALQVASLELLDLRFDAA